MKNVFYFSGYDGSIINFLLGSENRPDQPKPETAEELFNAAMDQEILKLASE